MSIVESIIDKIEEVKLKRDKVFSYIDSAVSESGVRFDKTKNITTHYESIESIKSRSILIISFFESLGWNNLNYDLVPYFYMDQFHNSLAAVLQHLVRIENNINNIESNGGIGSLNVDTYEITSSNQSSSINFSSDIILFDEEMDKALSKFYLIKNVAADGISIDLSSIKNEVEKLNIFFEGQKLESLDNLKSIKAAKKKIDELQSDINVVYDSVKNLSESSEKINQESSGKLEKVKELGSEVDAITAYINQQYELAKNLNQQITDYQADFESFKSALDERKKNI